MRLIDADEVKRRMLDGCCTMAYHFVDETPTASPWHRVEEGLPKYTGRYLVWDVDGFAHCDTWKDDKWQIASRVPGTNISHWMPIEPPKEDA